MGVRFDEVELFKGPDGEGKAAGVVTPAVTLIAAPPAPPLALHRKTEHASPPPVSAQRASRWRRILTFTTDLSLFVALALALSPLLPSRGDWLTTLQRDWMIVVAFGAFLLMLSFYYFVFSWTVWGKTVGGAIFDQRISTEEGAPITFRDAARRWGGTIAAIATCGGGFAIALLPGAKSLPDRMSGSRCFVAK